MSYDCYISVQVPIHDPAGMIELAREFAGNDATERHCQAFIADMAAERFYLGKGPKGDVLMWGQVGNHLLFDDFAHDAAAFMERVMRSSPDAVPAYKRWLILCQPPEGDIFGYSVYLDGGDTWPSRVADAPLRVERFELPATFGIV